MPRSKGYRHNQDTRDKIQASLLIKRLEDHVNAEKPILDSSQVNAAKALLNKVLPDLKAVEHTGEDGGPLQVQIVRYADSPDSK